MARVYLSLGSNIDRKVHLASALDALHEKFGNLILSPVYESKSVGFDGDDFLNSVVGLDTQLSVGGLSAILKGIEDDNGRDRASPKFSGRTLDIDILTYDKLSGVIDGVELPRDEVTVNAYVLKPMFDIAGDEIHPVLNKTYAELWDGFQNKESVWPVHFEWQNKLISKLG